MNIERKVRPTKYQREIYCDKEYYENCVRQIELMLELKSLIPDDDPMLFNIDSIIEMSNTSIDRYNKYTSTNRTRRGEFPFKRLRKRR
jgi:hypothetical protein